MNKLLNAYTKSVLKTALALIIATSTHSALAKTSQTSDGLAAVVNESPILKSELQQATIQLRELYKKSGNTVPDQNTLKKQALDQLIMQELQLNLVKRAGIKPTDRAINAQLARYAKAQGVSSIPALQKKMNKERKGSYIQLRNAIINELAIQAVRRNQINKRIKISNQDVEKFIISPEGKVLNKNQYQTIHIRVPYTGSTTPTAKQKNELLSIAKYVQNQLINSNDYSKKTINQLLAKTKKKYATSIQGGNMGYNSATSLPPKLATTIVGMNKGQVSIIETDSGIDIIKLADKKVSNALLVPQWRTRHILIATNKLQNKKMAEYKINDIYEKLRKGADFTKLASTYSDDPGSASRGGDLDWVSEGSMVPEFEAVMKNTTIGDFSIPFKSQYGWHILQVVDTRTYDASDEIQKGMAKELLFKKQLPKAQAEWMQELRSSSYIRVF